jgi:hypothetical protein
VPRHVARLVTWLVAPLVVDYSASRRLVVDYFASTARPGASACRAALVTRLVASLVVDYSASRRLVVDNSASAGLSSTTSPLPSVRVPRHVARLVKRLVAPLVVDNTT